MVVGDFVGVGAGAAVGTFDGEALLGLTVGEAVVGELVGTLVCPSNVGNMLAVGSTEGWAEMIAVGPLDGSTEGCNENITDGFPLGNSLLTIMLGDSLVTALDGASLAATLGT